MRKSVLTILIIVLVLLLGASGTFYSKLKTSRANYAALQTEEQATRDRYGMAINEIATIQDSLNAIVMGADGAAALKTELDAERNLSQDRKDAALERISEIKAGIERARSRIQELEDNLAASDVKIAGLEKMIGNLRSSISEKETMVAQLTVRVSELQTQVAGLNAEVQQNKQVIQAQTTTIQSHESTIQTQVVKLEDTRRALGTIYYTIGSKDDLKEAGSIVSTGGFLGLGKTVRPSGKLNLGQFTALDTDKENTILIPADEAKVVSDQPLGSYSLELAGEDQMQLRILDPQAFRTVKHLIIVTG